MKKELGLGNLDQQKIEDLPVLVLSLRAVSKIFGFTDKSPVEINGWGLVDVTDYERENRFIVPDVFILEQEVSGGEAEGDQDKLMEYLSTCKEPKKIKFQWHSHVNMSVWFSSVDERGIEDYGCSADYMISMIVNKRRECICRLDLFRPFRMTYEILVYVAVPIEKSILDFCSAEFDAKVRLRVPSRTEKFVNAVASVTGFNEKESGSGSAQGQTNYLFMLLTKHSE